MNNCEQVIFYRCKLNCDVSLRWICHSEVVHSSDGSRISPGRGNPNLLFGHIFGNNCMKSERIWTARRGRAFLAPPRIRELYWHDTVLYLYFSADRRRSWTACSSGRCARFSSVSPRSRPHRPRPRFFASSSTTNSVKPYSHRVMLRFFSKTQTNALMTLCFWP